MTQAPPPASGDKLDISARKQDHLDLCAGDEVDFRNKSTLFEQCRLVHCALPELHVDEIDSHVELLGKRLQAPLVISAMTGGTQQAQRINQELAQVAQELGLGMGLGSQRAMLVRPETAPTFAVREHAPDILLMSNLGIVQARDMSTQQVQDLVESVGADALCVHMNPAMEIVQPGGDRDFRGGMETLSRLVQGLAQPVVAKETGCGISRFVGERLLDAGIRNVDVSGAGGTSWVGVEAHRADPQAAALAQEMWDWGIPTAASLLQLQGLGLSVIATGGLRSGGDVAKAIALGASAGGIAAGVLKAHKQRGIDGARSYLQAIIHSIRAHMLLTGSGTVAQLQRSPVVLGPDLKSWRA